MKVTWGQTVRPRQLAEFLLEMLKSSPKTVVLKEDINALNTMIVELGESGSVVDNYSDLVGKTQTLTVVVKDYIALVDAANNNNKNSVEHLLQRTLGVRHEKLGIKRRKAK